MTGNERPLRWRWIDHVREEAFGIDKAAVLVAHELCHRARETRGECVCWPSITNIAANTRTDRKTVMRAIGTLEIAGLLRVDRRDGRNHRFELVLPVPAIPTQTATYPSPGGTAVPSPDPSPGGTGPVEGPGRTTPGTAGDGGTQSHHGIGGVPPRDRPGVSPVPPGDTEQQRQLQNRRPAAAGSAGAPPAPPGRDGIDQEHHDVDAARADAFDAIKCVTPEIPAGTDLDAVIADLTCAALDPADQCQRIVAALRDISGIFPTLDKTIEFLIGTGVVPRPNNGGPPRKDHPLQ